MHACPPISLNTRPPISIFWWRFKTVIYHLSVVCFCFTACSTSDNPDNKQERIQEALSDTLTQSTESWDVYVTIYEDTLRKVTIKAGYAVNRQDIDKSFSIFEKNVRVTVWDTVNVSKISSIITCDRARYDTKDAVFECYGGVEVETSDNKHLSTEYLRWKQETDNIFSDRYVSITTEEDSISGVGLTGKADLSVYQIKNVRGSVATD